MSHGTATPAACQPAHQHVVPMPGIDGPDVAALERVRLAGTSSLVIQPRAGWASAPSESIAWIGNPKRDALNTADRTTERDN